MANELQQTQTKIPTVAEAADNIIGELMTNLKVSVSSGLVLQKNYIPENALQAAKLAIIQCLDKDKKPALTVCTKESVKQAVQQMLQEGLTPAKKQGYFIVFGNKLTWLTSYFGEQAKAKYADPSIDDIYGEVVYNKDKFAYQIKRAYKIITLHEQAPENIILTEIKGAYATIVYKDGSEKSDYMTWQQIQNSWARGEMKGQSSAHKGAPEEMCKRTVLRRLCKAVYNTSDDTELVNDEAAEIDRDIDQKQNREPIDITPAESQSGAATSAGFEVDADGVIQDEPIQEERDPNQPDQFPA